MPINIEMPKLSDTMTEGTVVKWHKQAGDTVEIGDIIADIETDKATMEMEAFDEGTIVEIKVQEGTKAPVGEVLAILAEEGEDVDAAPAASAAPAAAPAKEEAASAPAAASAAPAAAAPATTADGERLKVSPLARKIAASKGVDLTSIAGSGPGGRIVKADVENAQASPAPAAKPAAASAPAAAPAPQAIQPTVNEEDKVIPLSSMRKIIADRLLTSKQTIPHFYLHVEVDAAPLMSLRKQVNAQAEQTHGNKYTVNDFIVKAMINACVAVPEVNASYTGDSIVQFANVGVSVAIAVEDGLVTPVVKAAQTKSLLQISQEIKDMAVRARDKKLKPNEFDGGTITISNLGAWGIESFDAIVNPPQAAILSVGGIIEKPVSINGEIKSGLRMNIGLSCDHRVVDGAVAATFLNEVKKLLEKPALMLV
ncbi:pyruvate dehydrogenase E2 component (dihydrolipoamide acetyltransferase) [Rubritalea squalenifaciens DSM 18772]|uniref:Acetyltransferase component of pyruvate dehydrogenase complex n=1 Tax=Rubritalea squalenifaciens DSM 18772 TaxID=1123071 RepID=A0A1M6BK52_9BACT|nr:pyruvate dehydrogenase complex dihydrolipoamide acetyltransferase [Rubritalea squalenifaciens]SHI49084.1 pyruvate dehydrogenase E2 component (dihydrolipoamide acetyltransferase) [Rubritalea squalenifaciens DSM 18772]